MKSQKIILSLLTGLQLYAANASAGQVLSCRSSSHGHLVDTALDVIESEQGLTYTFSIENSARRTVYFKTGDVVRTNDGFQQSNLASIVVSPTQVVFQDHLTRIDTVFAADQCQGVSP